MAKKRTYKKQLPAYPLGGWMTDNAEGLSSAASGVGGVLSAFENPEKANVGLGTAKGALAGFTAGAALGPPGMIVGAALGAIGGLFGGLKKRKALKKAARARTAAEATAKQQRIQQVEAVGASKLQGYDTEGVEDVEYYGYGGIIPSYGCGGRMKKMQEGGMMEPEYEVEQGEVVQGGDTQLEEGQELASDMTLAGGETHANGGTLGQGGERVYSDRIPISESVLISLKGVGAKVNKNTTYAQAAEAIGKRKGASEKKMASKFYPTQNTGKRELERQDKALDMLFESQEINKNTTMATNQFAQGGGLERGEDYGSKKKPYPSVSAGSFAGGGRSYPIPTRADAVDALRLAGLHGRSDVKAKVYAKYPDLKKAYGGMLGDIPPKVGTKLKAGDIRKVGSTTNVFVEPTGGGWGDAEYAQRNYLDAITSIDAARRFTKPPAVRYDIEVKNEKGRSAVPYASPNLAFAGGGTIPMHASDRSYELYPPVFKGGGTLPKYAYGVAGPKPKKYTIPKFTPSAIADPTGAEPTQTYFPTTTATPREFSTQELRAITEDPNVPEQIWNPKGEVLSTAPPASWAAPTEKGAGWGSKALGFLGENVGQVANFASYMANLRDIKKIDTSVPRAYMSAPQYNYVDRSGTARSGVQQAFRTAGKAMETSTPGASRANIAAAHARTIEGLSGIAEQESRARQAYGEDYMRRRSAVEGVNVGIQNEAQAQEAALKMRKNVELPLAARNAFMQGVMGNIEMGQRRQVDRDKMALSAFLANADTGVIDRLKKQLPKDLLKRWGLAK